MKPSAAQRAADIIKCGDICTPHYAKELNTQLLREDRERRQMERFLRNIAKYDYSEAVIEATRIVCRLAKRKGDKHG